MKIIGLILLLASFSTFANTDTRCGWIFNPTPGNIALIDGEGEWIIGIQRGYHAKGELTSKVSSDNFIEVNGRYGYYCGCVTGEYLEGAKIVTKIHSDTAQPLKVCLQDPDIPSMK